MKFLLAAAALLLLRVGAAAAQQNEGAAEYPTGDSCLFCHRGEVAETWLINSHAWTIRHVGEPPETGSLPADATHVIGREHYRALKQHGYGKFDLFAQGGWQANDFAQRCAGCHTTAVNPRTGEFSSIALDCYSCHGNVPEDHATRKGVALFARTRKAAPQEVVSICGSCHLRGGRSKATGQPYPNTTRCRAVGSWVCMACQRPDWQTHEPAARHRGELFDGH